MADLNISEFSQKVQNYIAENNIDKNQDGKINEGSELQTLLSGNNEISSNDTATFSSRRRIMINNPVKVLEAIANYNSQSPEERQKVVDRTETLMYTKLEALEKTVKANFFDLYTELENPLFASPKMPLGGHYTWENLWKESIKDFVENLYQKFQKVADNNTKAFDNYIGNDVYQQTMLLGDAPHKALQACGYNSLDELAADIASYQTYLEYDGSNYDEYMQNKQKQGEILDKFIDAFTTACKAEIDEVADQDIQKVQAYKTSYENAMPALENTVDNGITQLTEIKDYVTERTFENCLLSNLATTSVESAKVEVNGKEYEVGKKYQEEGPDGKPRIVTYDKLGNKWDMRGFKVDE